MINEQKGRLQKKCQIFKELWICKRFLQAEIDWLNGAYIIEASFGLKMNLIHLVTELVFVWFIAEHPK